MYRFLLVSGSLSVLHLKSMGLRIAKATVEEGKALAHQSSKGTISIKLAHKIFLVEDSGNIQ